MLPITRAKRRPPANWLRTSELSRILAIGTAHPPVRLTQEQSFHAAGYESEGIRKIFLNSDIDYRHFCLEGALNRKESPIN
jgi:hypothetical protein